MSGRLAVFGATLPTVLLYYDVAAPEVNHRLYAYAHAFLQYGATSAATIVGDFRVLVHLATDAMPAHLADNGVAMTLAVGLDRIGDIPYTFPFLGRSNSLVKGFLGDLA